MKTMKRIFSLLLSVLLIFCVFAVCAAAEDKDDSGYVEYGSTCEATNAKHEVGAEGSNLVLIKDYSCAVDLEHSIIYFCNDCGKARKDYVTHDHKMVVDEGKDKTCTEDGLTEGSHCSVCGYVEKEQEVIKAGHVDDNGDGYCDVCPAELRYHCPYCGEEHNDRFGPVVNFFHRLLAYFGLKK